MSKAGEAYCNHYFNDKKYHLGYFLQARLFSEYIASEDRVLDFGCGNAGLLFFLQESCKEIAGLEINPASLSKARELGIKNRLFTSYEELPNNYFTIAYSNHVLEHVLDPLFTLRTIHETLQQGGKLILILPIDDYRDKHQRTWVQGGDLDGHLYTWTPRLITNLLAESEFEVLAADVLATAWTPKLFPLYRLPILGGFFRYLTAVLLKRRQLRVVAQKKT